MDLQQYRKIQTRRNFFRNCAGGIGTMALANLLESESYGATVDTNPLAPKPPMFAPKARNVIFMFDAGRGLPSHFSSSGFGSNKSSWLGPPSMNMKMTFLAFGANIGGLGASGFVSTVAP